MKVKPKKVVTFNCIIHLIEASLALITGIWYVGNENKAYAIAFYLQDQEKTLNDKQIDKIMSKLIYRFENELNAVIRK